MFVFFNDTATTEIYTLSLHDALPIYFAGAVEHFPMDEARAGRYFLDRDVVPLQWPLHQDRKSTRLNSSHANISYAVFCLQKKRRARNRGSYREPARSKKHRSELHLRQ